MGPPGLIWTAGDRRRWRVVVRVVVLVLVVVLALGLDDDVCTTAAAGSAVVLVGRDPPQPAAINPAATASPTSRAIRNMPDGW
jgi:hypothetical protein